MSNPAHRTLLVITLALGACDTGMVATDASHDTGVGTDAHVDGGTPMDDGTSLGDSAVVDTGTPVDSSTPMDASMQTDAGNGVTFHMCASPMHTLPTNPSNPQDGITLSGYYVDTDTWNFADYPGSDQTMYVCDFDNWYAMVSVNDSANDGAVKTYPNVHKDYGGSTISSFGSIRSTYAHTAPSTGAWDYAYDVWFNDYNTELMIWTQSAGRQAHVPGINIVGNVTIDGIAYTIHHEGDYTAYDMTTSTPSGNIDVLHIIQDMISRGYVTGSATLDSIQYGVEVCDTGGTNTRFEVNNFSVTTN